jgi:hypothetical protein
MSQPLNPPKLLPQDLKIIMNYWVKETASQVPEMPNVPQTTEEIKTAIQATSRFQNMTDESKAMTLNSLDHLHDDPNFNSDVYKIFCHPEIATPEDEDEGDEGEFGCSCSGAVCCGGSCHDTEPKPKKAVQTWGWCGTCEKDIEAQNSSAVLRCGTRPKGPGSPGYNPHFDG